MPDARPDRRYAWYVLIVLSTINFMNYVDRQVMFALYPYIQDDLGFSDFQLGLLGAAFLLLHSVASVPGGLLADRWYKRKVISIGVALWSIATVLGALARGFVDLFVYRALVGVGEAAYHPAANAMISDYFPPTERGRAMGIFSVGMVLGGGGGMIAGTVVADYLGWRYAFLVAGIPGFILATLAWYLREAHRKAPPKAERREKPRGPSSWRRLVGTPTVRYNFAGGICVTFCIGGIIAWTVTFLDRYFVQPKQTAAICAPLVATAPGAGLPAVLPGLGPALLAVQTTASTAAALREVVMPRAERAAGELAGVSASFGVVALLAGVLGSLVGGYFADRLMRWRRSGRLLVSAGGFLIGAPFVVGGIYAGSVETFLICLAPGMFFFTWYMGPSIAILHDVVPYRFRATSAAYYIFAVHLLGDAISPPIIGWISQESELRHALLLPVGVALLGCLFFLLGTRTVASDMDLAAREGATEMAA
jgi:MFS family permease